MNQLVRIDASSLPALITAAGDRAGVRFVEFFTANIRNPHTPATPMRARSVISSPGAPLPACAPSAMCSPSMRQHGLKRKRKRVPPLQ